MWKRIRVIVLFGVLAIVAANAWLDSRRITDWRGTVEVGVFPIAGDTSPATQAYINSLDPGSLAGIDEFMAEQSKAYRLPLIGPVHVSLYPVVTTAPPPPPPSPNILSSVWWSLRMRFYASRMGHTPDGRSPHIRMFVLFHDPLLTPSLAHSVGLRKGGLSVVNAFASRAMEGRNVVVITHELLHTFGASDKYDLATNSPLYPDGYAEPGRTPRFPQRWTEIMAGRRPVSATEAVMPDSLDDCVVGAGTAAEIHWTRN